MKLTTHEVSNRAGTIYSLKVKRDYTTVKNLLAFIGLVFFLSVAITILAVL